MINICFIFLGLCFFDNYSNGEHFFRFFGLYFFFILFFSILFSYFHIIIQPLILFLHCIRIHCLIWFFLSSFSSSCFFSSSLFIFSILFFLRLLLDIIIARFKRNFTKYHMSHANLLKCYTLKLFASMLLFIKPKIKFVLFSFFIFFLPLIFFSFFFFSFSLVKKNRFDSVYFYESH